MKTSLFDEPVFVTVVEEPYSWFLYSPNVDIKKIFTHHCFLIHKLIAQLYDA